MSGRSDGKQPSEKPNPHWDKTLSRRRVYGDPHFSGKWGFSLVSMYVDYEFDFDSGLVYSSEEDAQVAADQAAHIAWQWAGVCHGAASRTKRAVGRGSPTRAKL